MQLVRYVMRTAEGERAVLPPLTETLLDAEKLRAMALAIHEKVVDPNDQQHPRNPCGRAETCHMCRDNSHPFFRPVEEDRDGSTEHVTVLCRVHRGDAHNPNSCSRDEARKPVRRSLSRID